MLRGRRRRRKRELARVADRFHHLGARKSQRRAALVRDFDADLLRPAGAGFGFGFAALSLSLFVGATALPASPFAVVSADLSLDLSPGLSPDLSVGLSLDDSAVACSTKLRLVSLLFLKSVSYQPLPFNRNCEAETSLFSCDLPHSGHLRSGPSLIFCKASRWCPQALQRYS